MLNVALDQMRKLQDIAEAIETTSFGNTWPQEYKELFTLWGFFNGFYNTLYTDHEEWKRIGRFAIDTHFSQIWKNLSALPAVRVIAEQPCVGDGRDNYVPSPNIRIAFHTLRLVFKIDLQEACQNMKCQTRQQKNISTCLAQQWQNSPQAITNPADAKYSPLGATLLIVYQIRNNLFHGSKREIHGPDFERNQLLVQNSARITRALLEAMVGLIPKKP